MVCMMLVISGIGFEDVEFFVEYLKAKEVVEIICSAHDPNAELVSHFWID